MITVYENIRALLVYRSAPLRRNQKLIIVLSLALLLSSCVKEIELEVERQVDLVINSIFQPNTSFSCFISYTASTLEEFNAINDTFHLKLYEEDDLLIDTLIAGDIFISEIYPNNNNTYRIEVIRDHFTSVWAEDSIPDLVSIQDAFLVFPAGTDKYGDYVAEANITFIDPPNEKNYYELLIFSGTEEKSYWNLDGDVEATDPVLLNEGDLDYFPSSIFFSDELINGEEYTIKVKDYLAYSVNEMGFNPETIYATLRSVSKNYYFYRKYYTRHAYNQQFQGDFLDLVFRGEPQTMFTNIENGYGIFAGYQETTKELYHKE